jgi:hypothetical protein
MEWQEQLHLIVRMSVGLGPWDSRVGISGFMFRRPVYAVGSREGGPKNPGDAVLGNFALFVGDTSFSGEG